MAIANKANKAAAARALDPRPDGAVLAPADARALLGRVAADRERVDALQETAMLSVINVATSVSGPEPKVVSAVLTDVATYDLALSKPADSIAEGVNRERPSSTGPLSVETAPADRDSPETPVVLASVPAAEIPVDSHFADAPPLLGEMRSLGSLFTSDPLKRMLPAVRPVETPSECPAPEICIDDYLWALYERTPKIDTNKVLERVRVKAKVTIKKKSKTRTVTKIIIKTNIKYSEQTLLSSKEGEIEDVLVIDPPHQGGHR